MDNENDESTFSLYCQVSTFMGVIDWYSAKSIVGKIFWALMLTAGLGVTIWQTQGVISQFVNRAPYQTSSSRDVVEGGILYPGITVCNFNRAKQSLINETKLDTKVLSYAFQLVGSNYPLPLYIMPGLNLTDYEYAWKKHSEKYNYKSPKDFFRKYGHSFKESVILVTIGGVPVPTDHEEVWTIFGRCLRLLPPANLTQTIPGPNNAIKIYFNPNLKEYMTDQVVNNFVQEGLIILPNYVHETTMTEPLFVAPSTFTAITLSATKSVSVIEDTPLLAPSCRMNTTLKILNETYTPQNCMFDCYLQYVWGKCGCVSLASVNPAYPICNLTTYIKCASVLALLNITLEQYSLMFQANFTAKLPPMDWSGLSAGPKELMNCMNDCDKPCGDGYMRIHASATTTNGISRFLRSKLLNYIKNASTISQGLDEDFADNFINVELYFSSPEITVLTTSENIPIFTFIGNIGGQLGLWIGISLLSLVQLVYYLIVACFKGELFPSCKKRNKSKVMEAKPFQSTDNGCKIQYVANFQK